jgi:hypothetical protein
MTLWENALAMRRNPNLYEIQVSVERRVSDEGEMNDHLSACLGKIFHV